MRTLTLSLALIFTSVGIEVRGQVDQEAEIRALVQRLTLERPAKIVPVQKKADECEAELFEELQTKAQRDVIVSHTKLGMLGTGSSWHTALSLIEDPSKRGILSPSDRPLLELIREKIGAIR